VSLRVRAVPGAPVTFTSLDMGAFQNRLASITVRADGEGVAVARFTGTPGTLGLTNVLAASPLTSGQQHFTVSVLPADPAALQRGAEPAPRLFGTPREQGIRN